MTAQSLSVCSIHTQQTPPLSLSLAHFKNTVHSVRETIQCYELILDILFNSADIFSVDAEVCVENWVEDRSKFMGPAS